MISRRIGTPVAGHVDSATVSTPRITVKNRVSLAHHVYNVLPPTRKRHSVGRG
jgi:hypothetical protein